MNPQFSVIIPTYNRRAFIAEAVESALEQTYPPSEVIVYDDGSTDDTESIVERFADRIKYIQASNGGVVMARKNAIAMATGDWIALLDSDDMWRPTYLEDVVNCVKCFPVAEVVVTNFCNMDNRGVKFFDRFAAAPDGWWSSVIDTQKNHFALLRTDCYLHFLKYQPVFPSAMAFRTKIYDSIGGMNPRVSRLLAEDSHLTRRMVAAGRVACNTEKNVVVRQHDSNMSGDTIRNFTDRIRILELLLEEGDVPKAYQEETMRTIGRWRYELFNKLFEHSRYSEMPDVYDRLPPQFRTPKVKWKRWIGRIGRVVAK